MHDLDPTERRRLLRLHWPEMPEEQFEALCEVWDGGWFNRQLRKFHNPKIPREKKREFEFPLITTADFPAIFDPSYDPARP